MNAVDVVPERVACPGAEFRSELTQRYDRADLDLVFIVGTNGSVETGSVMVLESTDPGFDAPTIDMISRCRFSPGRKDGEAVRVQVRMPMQFTFRETAALPLPDSLEMNRVFNEADSVNGQPILTRYPEMITCPRYDPQNRASRSRASDRYEREQEIERLPENVEALLEIVIGIDGEPEPRLSKVLRTSDFRFNETLTQWVRSCRFNPGMIGARAVRVRIEFPVKFSFVRE